MGRQPRRFPKPWSIEVLDACFIVKDAGSFPVAYVYYGDTAWERAGPPEGKMTKDEARRIANAIARLPELLVIEKAAKSGFTPDEV